MVTPILIKGIMLGFAIAAPVGPIALLCIRRTLIYGSMAGFFSGLGAATADSLYGVIAAYSVAMVSNIISMHQILLRIVSGIFLLYIGIDTFLSRPNSSAVAPYTKGNLIAAYFSTFTLTITNPLTIVSFAALFAALGFATNAPGNSLYVTQLIIGIFLGSALWWLSLSTIIGFVRKKISLTTLQVINKFSGSFIILCALAAFLSIFWRS